MAIPCARGLMDLLFKQKVSFLVRTAFQARQLVTTASACQAIKPPNKPLNAFLRFLAEKRPEIQANNPGLSMGDLSKVAGEMWRGLDPQEKAHILATTRAEMAEYHKQLKAFEQEIPKEDLEAMMAEKRERIERRKIRRKKAKDREILKLKPVRTRGSFALFMKASKLEKGDATSKAFFKQCQDQWTMMPPEEKQIYINDAHLDKERYRKEMKEYEDMLQEMGREDLIRVAARPKKSSKKSKTTKTSRKSKTMKPSS